MKVALANKHAISIKTRYTAAIFALCISAMVILAFMLVYKQIQQNNQYIEKLGEVVVSQLAFSVDELIINHQISSLQTLIDEYVSDFSIKGILIVDAQKKRIVSSGKLPKKNRIHFDSDAYTLPFIKEDRFFHWGGQYIIHNHGIYHDNKLIGYAVVAFSYEILHEDFEEQIFLMLLISSLLILIASLAAIQIGKKLSQPIMRLLSATEQIRLGHLDQIPDRRNDEIGSLINAINQMSEGLVRKNEIENLLNKFLDRDVAEKVIDQLDPIHMSGEQVEATVLFADIVGFTRISENISPEDVQSLLNEYYQYFNACAKFYFGTVDKFIGDCIMVVFGASKPDAKHQFHALSCAILMQRLADKLNKQRIEMGLFSIEMRIGINSGQMLAGLIGSRERMEYTVVGDAVNLASRLCNEAEGSETIIEESLFQKMSAEYAIDVETYKAIRIRDKSEPITIYSVRDIEQPYQVVMDDLIEDILEKNK